jgi:hypothetical protein
MYTPPLTPQANLIPAEFLSSNIPRTRSYKKDDEPLTIFNLNLMGGMSRCSKEKVLMCTQTEENVNNYAAS